jgi:hypothetical protein
MRIKWTASAVGTFSDRAAEHGIQNITLEENMARSTTFASLAILGALAASPALAQAPTNLTAMPADLGSVVGGGGASLSGGGDDMTISYSQGGAGGGIRYEQPGRMTTFGGNSGGSPYWIGAPAPGGVGREAQVIGGGEDLQVVYVDRMGARRR